jgi:hypothetical protein
VSSDQELQTTLDRMLSGFREQLEAGMRAHADEVARRAHEDVRRKADVEIAQLHEAAKKEAEESRKSAEAQIADLHRLLDDLRRSAQQQIDEARKSLDSGVAAARVLDLRIGPDARRVAQSQVEDVQRESDARIFDLMRQLTEVREEAARSARLLDAIRTLDETTSLGGVLERVVQFAGREVDRAALMIVKSDILYAWRLIGFDLNGQTTEPMDVPLDDVGLLGSAVREGHVVMRLRSDDSALRLPAFAVSTATRAAAAFPVSVAGTVVAVLYADAPEADDAEKPEWCHRMETVTRSASRVLEALTVELATGRRPLLVQPSHGAPGHHLSEGAQ